MKNRFLAVFLVLIILICCSFPFSFNASADALTMQMIVSSAYAISQNAGLAWTFSGMTGTDASDYLGNQINSWLGGSTIAEKFGTEALRLQAGKLIIPAAVYNGIADFLDDFSKNHDYYGDNGLVYAKLGKWNFVPAGVEEYKPFSSVSYRAAYNVIDSDSGTIQKLYGGAWGKSYNVTNDGLSVTQGGGYTSVYGIYSYNYGSSRTHDNVQLKRIGSGEDIKTINTNDGSYVAPTVIDPSQAWVGQFDNIPDTNLDQLMGDILDDIADNNLVVEGEVIDPPAPSPTPAPIDPDLPLSDVPWEGLDTNLQQLYEQGLEEIGKIGEAKDAITGAIEDQTGAIEDAISDNAGVVSGAIDQAVSDVQTAIGEQTAALEESLTATAEGVETIAEAIEDEAINWRKFELKALFPFCIPFDIYNMLNALDASPTAPHVQIPFVIQSIGFSYLIDLDFSAFDPVAAIMRQMELICYGLALAWATSKVIKW